METWNWQGIGIVASVLFTLGVIFVYAKDALVAWLYSRHRISMDQDIPDAIGGLIVTAIWLFGMGILLLSAIDVISVQPSLRWASGIVFILSLVGTVLFFCNQDKGGWITIFGHGIAYGQRAVTRLRLFMSASTIGMSIISYFIALALASSRWN